MSNKENEKISSLYFSYEKDFGYDLLNGKLHEDAEFEPIEFRITGILPGDGVEVLRLNGAVLNRTRLLAAVDAQDGDMAAVAERICDLDTGSLLPQYANKSGSKACFLDRLWVDPEYRGHGAASLVLSHLGPILRKVFPYMAGIYARVAPWELAEQPEKFQARQAELLRFYGKFGFQQIEGSECLWRPVPNPPAPKSS